MMPNEQDELFFRTEDIPQEDIDRLFVETPHDREIIDKLKGRLPIILVGSRGVGKSFLLRVAEKELSSAYTNDRVLPVYTTFNRSSLLVTSDPLQFQHYMLARICSRLIRALTTHGLAASNPPGLSIIAGGVSGVDATARMEEISRAYETSFRTPGAAVSDAGLPSLDDLRDAIEALCAASGINRIVLLLDEAAHVFRPEQQRQFFTLFRDLRSPQLSCNAAVYPGVTTFGDSFQPAHDATFVFLQRDVLASGYIAQMKDIVTRQAASGVTADIARNGQNFGVLAYASGGNPRLLLKTVAKAPRINSTQVNEVVKSFYRVDLWSEHSGLAEKYPRLGPLIDWGRNFIELTVLPELKARNDAILASAENSETTSYFWIHKDAPAVVKQALRLLEYTGIVHEHTRGLRATRSEIGTRYSVNLGCLMALESVPRDTGFQVATRLGVRRFPEYGANHPTYQSLVDQVPILVEPDAAEALTTQLAKDINVLDITHWQQGELRKIGLTTVGLVLGSDETALQQIRYVGERRARRMMNAAMTAVLEYMSG